MVVVEEAGRLPMEVADKSNTEGIIIMPTTVPDPLEARGVKPALETEKEIPRRTVGIVVRRATERASVGRRKLIRTNLD